MSDRVRKLLALGLVAPLLVLAPACTDDEGATDDTEESDDAEADVAEEGADELE